MKIKKDPWPMRASVLVIVVVLLILIICSVLADSTSIAIFTLAGLENQEIHESLNAPFLLSFTWYHWFAGVIIMYSISFISMKYLEYGDVFENGLLGLPYKRDFYGKVEYEENE